MEEEQAVGVNSPSLGAVSHLLQHTLRSLCSHSRHSSRWLYAVFWRILPRNYPPPKWDFQGGVYDRNRGNIRNWILAWEDGFCNFAAASEQEELEMDNNSKNSNTNESVLIVGLQPELFFKMSHEIYNYGEGLIGKVAADHGHKWVFREPQNRNNLLSTLNPSDSSHPRTWEAQFQSGVETIALVAVREGVVQLASNSKVAEDLSFVVLLRRQFDYLESIPGFLLPHPSVEAAACSIADGYATHPPPPPLPLEYSYSGFGATPAVTMIAPSMSSLEALLSKLPPVGQPQPQQPAMAAAGTGPRFEIPVLVQTAEDGTEEEGGGGGSGGSSMASYYVEAEKGLN